MRILKKQTALLLLFPFSFLHGTNYILTRSSGATPLNWVANTQAFNALPSGYTISSPSSANLTNITSTDTFTLSTGIIQFNLTGSASNINIPATIQMGLASTAFNLSQNSGSSWTIGGLTLPAGAVAAISGGTNSIFTVSNGLTLGAGATINFNSSPSARYSLGGALSFGNTSVINLNTGTLNLTNSLVLGTNNMVTLQGGINATINTNAVTLGSGSTLVLNGDSTSDVNVIGSVSLNQNAVLAHNAGTLSVSGTLATVAGSTANVNGAMNTVLDVQAVTISPNSTLVLAGASSSKFNFNTAVTFNTASNLTLNTGGELKISAPITINDTSSLITINGGTLSFNGAGGTVFNIKRLTMAEGTALSVANGTLTIGNTLTASGSSYTLNVNAGGSLVFSGVGGATFAVKDLNMASSTSASVTAGTLTIGGSVTAGANSSLTVSSGASLAITGNWGTNGTSNGTITVNNTAASASIQGNLYAASLQANGATTFAAPASTTNVIGAPISGSGGMVIVGGNAASRVEFKGNNTYSGTTTINSGGLILTNATAIPSNTVTMTSANTGVYFNNTVDISQNTVFSGAGSLYQTGTARTILNGSGSSFTGKLYVNAGAMRLGANWLSTNSTRPVVYNGDNTTFEINCTTGTTSSPTQYSGSFTKTNSGYTTTFVKRGSGVLELTSPTLQISSFQVEGGSLIVSAQNMPPIDMALQSGGVYTLKTTNGVVTDYANVISGQGGILVNNSGGVSLNVPQTYTGPTTIDGGGLYLGVANGLSGSTDVTINATSGGKLSLKNSTNTQSFNTSVGSVSGSGPLELGTGVLTCGNASDQVYSGAITGSGGLVKQGTGTWTISGSNAGQIATTVINAGTIKVGSATALGASAITVSGGSLDLNGYSPTNTITSVSGEIKNSGSAATTISSPITLAGASSLNASGQSLVISAPISGSQALALTGAANRSVTLNDAVNVDGDITVSTTAVTHAGKVTAYNGKKYIVSSGSATLSSGAALSLAGSSYKINSGALKLSGATLQIDSTSAVATTTLSTDAGGSLELGASTTTSAPIAYGRMMEIAVGVTGSGAMTKSDLGTVKYSGSSLHTGATTIEGGKVILTDSSSSYGAQAMTLARYSSLEVEGSSSTIVNRPVSGDGHFIKSGAGELTMSGTMTYTGNTSVTNGSLIFSGAVTLGATANLSIADGCSLTYQSTLSPVASSFNPTIGVGSTLSFNGATISTDALLGSTLAIGNVNGAMTIGNGGLTINADKATTIFSNLLGSGTLSKSGSGNLTLASIGSAYTGGISISGSGSVTLTQDYTNTSNISVANTSRLIWELSSGLESTKNITGESTAYMIKRGAGTLLIDGTSKIDGFQGAIHVEKGAIQLRNTGLHANSAVTVYGGASLDVLCHGSAASTITMPSVNLLKRGALRIIRENPASASSVRQVAITSLHGENGGVLVLQFDPTAGSNTTPLASTASLQITSLTTANSNSDKISLQVRPISTQPLVAGQIYALIQPNGSTTTEQMISRLKLMPSIVYGAQYTLDNTPGTTVAVRYGNLIYNTDGIFIKIGEASQTGFYAGVINATDLTNAAPPQNAYYQTFLGNLLSHGQIAPYSALDRLLTAQYLNKDMSWLHMSPQSQNEINHAFLEKDFFMSGKMQEMFQWQSNFQKHQRVLQNTCIEKHQNLQTQSDVRNQGPWMGWAKSFEISGVTPDAAYIQDAYGQMTGVSLQLGGGRGLGYQYSKVQQSYQSVSKDREGQVISYTSQAQYTQDIGFFRMTTGVAATQHAYQNQRHIAVDIEENVQEWTAQSQHRAFEISGESAVMHEQGLGVNWLGSLGAKAKVRCVMHDAYHEYGAENLNLSVRSAQDAQYQIQPMVGLSYSWKEAQSYGYLQGTAGIECTFSAYGAQSFGFQACQNIQAHLPGEIKENYAYSFGIEGVVGRHGGLSVCWNSQVRSAMGSTQKEYQSSITAIHEF